MTDALIQCFRHSVTRFGDLSPFGLLNSLLVGQKWKIMRDRDTLILAEIAYAME